MFHIPGQSLVRSLPIIQVQNSNKGLKDNPSYLLEHSSGYFPISTGRFTLVHASKPSDKALFSCIGFVNRIKAIYHRSRCNTLILISNLRNMISSTIQHKYYCSSQFHNSSKSLYSSGIYLMHMQTEGGVD